MGFTKGISDEQLRWYRAAELKHGRISMLACLGWVHQSFGAFGGGLYFPTADGCARRRRARAPERRANAETAVASARRARARGLRSRRVASSEHVAARAASSS